MRGPAAAIALAALLIPALAQPVPDERPEGASAAADTGAGTARVVPPRRTPTSTPAPAPSGDAAGPVPEDRPPAPAPVAAAAPAAEAPRQALAPTAVAVPEDRPPAPAPMPTAVEAPDAPRQTPGPTLTGDAAAPVPDEHPLPSASIPTPDAAPDAPLRAPTLAPGPVTAEPVAEDRPPAPAPTPTPTAAPKTPRQAPEPAAEAAEPQMPSEGPVPPIVARVVPPTPPPRPSRLLQRAAVAPPGSRAPPDIAGSACTVRLRQVGGEFETLPPIEEGQCGAEAPLKVSALAGVALRPAATLRCSTALAVAAWIRDGLVPAAREHLDDQPTALKVAASYACRTRRTGLGKSQRLSEHALANALDVSGVTLRSGRKMSIAPRGPERDDDVERFQKAIRLAGCRTFKTVIGPLTDPAHSDHLHFDLAERRSDTVVCR